MDRNILGNLQRKVSSSALKAPQGVSPVRLPYGKLRTTNTIRLSSFYTAASWCARSGLSVPGEIRQLKDVGALVA